MKDRLDRLRLRIGRRGAFLLFLAILDFIIGYYLLFPVKGTPPQHYPLLPVEVWAGWWLGTSVACTVGAFLKVDRVAYGLAAFLMTAWGLRYAYLWFQETPLAWVTMTVWLIFAAIILIISGWPEEMHLPPEVQGDG